MVALLEERITAYRVGLVSDLDVITSVRLSKRENGNAINNITEHLRDFFRYDRSSFDHARIHIIRTLLKRNPSDCRVVHDNDGGFYVDHWYFAGRQSLFRVVSTGPWFEIEHAGSKASFSSDLKSAMWTDHLRHLARFSATLDLYERSLPTLDLAIAKIKTELEAEITETKNKIAQRHAKFLLDRGLKAASVINSTRMHRETHCYSCKGDLDNAEDLECAACGWIICSCGACGCGYERFKDDVNRDLHDPLNS